MNCKFCNAPMEADAQYCTNCGGKNDTVAAGVLPKMQQRNVIQCANKLHYYDAAVYTSCPHCASMGQNPQAASSVNNTASPAGTFAVADNVKKKKKEKKEKKPLFSFGKKAVEQAPVSPAYGASPIAGNQNKSSKTVALLDFENDGAEPIQEAAPEMPLSAKKAVMRYNAVQKNAEQKPVEQPPAKEQKSIQQDKEEHCVNVSSLEQNEYITPRRVQTPPQADNKKSRSDSSKTVAIYSDLSNDEPVVGWLVCVKGFYFGQSFNLVAGKNLIGRSPEMDIDLTGDDTVSRNTHATIIYEPKKRQFILKAGDNKGLTYINDELVLEYETLKSYDKIQLGECELIFVAFCNEEFTWDSYKDKA